MEIRHRLVRKTPFGDQETFVTDKGNIEVWGNNGGYRWRFTDVYFALTSDDKTYSTSEAAFKAAKVTIEV